MQYKRFSITRASSMLVTSTQGVRGYICSLYSRRVVLTCLLFLLQKSTYNSPDMHRSSERISVLDQIEMWQWLSDYT